MKMIKNTVMLLALALSAPISAETTENPDAAPAAPAEPAKK